MHAGISVVLKAEQLGSVFGFPITNSLVMAWVVMALLILGAYLFSRSLSLVPGKLQAGIEWAFEGALAYMADVLESRKLAERFFPLVASIFLFVAVINELEFFPGVGSLGLVHASEFLPVLRAPTTDLNFTLALAMISFLTIEITGIASLGFFKYAGKYVNLKSPIGFAVGLIELLSNLGRLISFSFRLFGNIFAGEVMVLVAGYFLPYILPAPLMGFEMFIGLIQALVFAMLTLFFIKLAIMEPHEAH
ncbi:MAG TPA: FoF1 ATP synthase subunit a [Candidatus Paceibacterota bacterium]|nr:FoF1 ATP synthase subunit a [Candidatus Paceibacterota bacterium]